MAVNCSQSVLTGADGMCQFAPAGTNFCLEASDFPAGTTITMPAGSKYLVGDPISFVEEGTATLDTAMVGGSPYVTKVLTVGATSISIEDPQNLGNPLTLNGDTVGTGANHIQVLFSDTQPVCSVQEWSLDLSKDQTDVTTLPCTVSSTGGGVAPVRKQQGTFLNGSGTMNLMFTGDTTTMGMRLLQNSVMIDSKVYAKLYINAVAGAGSVINDTASMYYEGFLTLLGFSISVNTTDALVAEVSFSLAEPPKTLFGVTV